MMQKTRRNQSSTISSRRSLTQTTTHGIGTMPLLVAAAVLLSLGIPTASAQSGDTRTDPYLDAKISPSMAIIIVVLIAALFFMGFFSIYIRHCTESRNGGASVRQVAGGRSRRLRGLDAAVLETLPTFAYSEVKDLKIGKGALECAVCLNEFEDDETLRLIPKCDHVFHSDCIDAWLASHTTCPVCRANLAGAESVHLAQANLESDSEGQQTETQDNQNDVVITVAEEPDQVRDQCGDQQQQPSADVVNLSQSTNQNRPPRPARSWSMKPRFFSKFPRSHSTGHSLVQPGENCERFTLRLPDDVRKQIVNRSQGRRLDRATSMVVLPRDSSSRRGYRAGGEGSSRGRNRPTRLDRADRSGRSDRWVFSIAPPFFTRAPSMKSPKVAADDEGTSTATATKTVLSAVKGPINCPGPKDDDAGSSSTDAGRALV